MQAFAVIAGGILIFAALMAMPSAVRGDWVGITVAIGSALGVAGLFALDQRRVRAEKARQAEIDERRLRDLYPRRRSAAPVLSVTGPSGLVIGLGMLVVSAVLGYASFDTRGAVLLGLSAICFLVAALILSNAVRFAGRPRLELSFLGIATPVVGQIPWRLIEGVYLQEFDYRGHKYYQLALKIPELSTLVPQFSIAERIICFFRRGSGKVLLSIRLDKLSETPQLVYAVARMLWFEATGRNFDWNPSLGDALNAVLRAVNVKNPDVDWWVSLIAQGSGGIVPTLNVLGGGAEGKYDARTPALSNAIQRMEELGRETDDLRHRNASEEERRAHAAKAAAELDALNKEADSEFRRVNDQLQIAARETKHHKRRTYIVVAIFVVVFLAYIGVRLVR